MSVDKYLGRTYNRAAYNCLHFACEVWRDVTGVDISGSLPSLLTGSVRDRRVDRSALGFRKLDRPTDPCLVLMRRPRTTPHIGVFIRGRVLHIRENGVEFQPVEIATLGFRTVGYYTC